MTFNCDSVYYDADESKTAVKNGKIMLGAAKNLHRMPMDSIVLDIGFDDGPYPAKYDFDHYRVKASSTAASPSKTRLLTQPKTAASGNTLRGGC